MLKKVVGPLISIVLFVACAVVTPDTEKPSNFSGSPIITSVTPVLNARALYHFMLGYQAELIEDTSYAIQEYQVALKIDPTSHSIKARLASLYFLRGDAPQAIHYASEATAGLGQDGLLLTQMAGVLASTGQEERALQLLERAVVLDSSSGDPYFAKGVLLLNLKRPSDAEQAIRAGLARVPESVVGQYHLGRVLLEVNQKEAATVSLERVIVLNTSFEPAYLALASIYESQEKQAQAVVVLQKYLQNVNPRNQEIRHQLVRLHVATKNFQDARKELGELLRENPSDLDAQLRLALVNGEEKDYPKAIDQLSKILRARPLELKIRDYLGFLYEESKDTKKAIETYTFNVELDSSYFEGHLHLGALLYRLKQFPEALTHLMQAIAINPKQPETHILLGLTYLQKDQFDEAAKILEEGVLQNPTSADLQFNLGTAYDRLNRFEDVVHAMEMAIKLDPHHADAFNYLGYSYAERGVKIEQALFLTKQAVALKPSNGYFVDSLAWALFKSGLLTESLFEMQRALALVSNDPVLYEHLGDIYVTQENLVGARDAWIRALELDPSNVKLMNRFRDLGMGDPNHEERLRRAQQRLLEKREGQISTP